MIFKKQSKMKQFILLVINVVLFCNTSTSQVTLKGSTLKNSVEFDISPMEFDSWVSRNRLTKDTLSVLSSRLLTRLSIGLFVSEDAIFKSIEIIAANEFKENDKYPKTVYFIDTILNLVYKREGLRNKLLRKKALFLVNSKSPEKEEYDRAIVAYKKMISSEDSLNLVQDLTLMEANLEIANLLSTKKREKEKALEHYRLVLQYPFYLITEPDAFSKARSAYIRAGRATVQLNRGNLKALQDLYFVPATTSELYPLLRSYIEEIGGKWDRGTPKGYLENLRN